MGEQSLCYLNQIPQFDEACAKLEKATKQDRKLLLAGFVGLLALLLAFFSGMRAVVYCVGFVYPTYRSVLAIQTPDADDDKKWLTYWVVYGSITTLDNVFTFITCWIPFWECVKLLLF